MSASPPVINDPIDSNKPGVFTGGTETHKFLIPKRRIEKPVLAIVGGDQFVWEAGLEGISISGAATIAEHKYLGDNAVVGFVTHRDTGRIEMTGQFSGKTGAQNVRDLRQIITAVTPKTGKILTLPDRVFIKQQFVIVESYNFVHAQDDRTDSFDYTINFLMVGVGKKTKVTKKTRPPSNPTSKKAKPRGKTARVFITRDGVRTLRAVAKTVYGNADRWNEIYSKNLKVLKSLNVPLHTLQVKVLPVGLKLVY
jgi:hypothetical protein